MNDVLGNVLMITIIFMFFYLLRLFFFRGTELVGHVTRDGSLDLFLSDRPPSPFGNTDLEASCQPVGK
jgi:hypothetical protein